MFAHAKGYLLLSGMKSQRVLGQTNMMHYQETGIKVHVLTTKRKTAKERQTEGPRNMKSAPSASED